jgi:hypothetical protein
VANSRAASMRLSRRIGQQGYSELGVTRSSDRSSPARSATWFA